MAEFRELLNRKIRRLFLIVWPPLGEKKESDVDISFGFVFRDDPQRLCVISVDKNELWRPHIFYQPLPQNKYTWGDYYPKIKAWMDAEEDSYIAGSEYFDVTECELFEKIVNAEIVTIELICIESDPDPFGIKIHFKDDYIISTPISDGNTVETSQFNRNENIELFRKIGKIEYKNIM